MNRYLEKLSFEYVYAQAKDADVEGRGTGPKEDFFNYKGKYVPEDTIPGVNSPRAKLFSRFGSYNTLLASGPKHSIRKTKNGHLIVELISEKTEKRDSPVNFGWEGKAKFGHYPSKEEFSSAIRDKVKVSPYEIPEEHINDAINGYSSFLKKRRLKSIAIGGAASIGIAGLAYAGNRYLNKTAEFLLDSSYIHTEDYIVGPYYSERLEALRKNRYLEKIAGKTGFKLDLDIQKVVKPKKVTTDEVLPFHERRPVSDEDWAHAKFLRDSGDPEGAKEHIRSLTHKTETTSEQRYELSKGFNALLGRWTRVK